MDGLTTLIADYGVVAVFVVLYISFSGIKQVWELILYFKNKIITWKNKEDAVEDEKESIVERISILERHDRWQYEKINSITCSLDEIKSMIVNMKENQDDVTVATCRSTLYQLHDKFTAQGYITKEGLKTFLELGKVYEAASGNDIYHDKLKPEVLSLELRE